MSRRMVWFLVALLIVLHQDFWFWDRIDPVVLGIIPIGLAYHAVISLAAASVWWLATLYCWPADVEVSEENATAPRSARGEL